MRKKIIIRSPNGYRVRNTIVRFENQIDIVYCKVFDNKMDGRRSIGDVQLERAEGKTFVTHSELDRNYHNKGLGTLIYAKAIAWALNHGYKVRSSGDSSEMAKRVWNGRGLRKYFKITKHTDNAFSFTRETWYATRKRTTRRKNK